VKVLMNRKLWIILWGLSTVALANSHRNVKLLRIE
jgi:hypothetical protein